MANIFDQFDRIGGRNIFDQFDLPDSVFDAERPGYAMTMDITPQQIRNPQPPEPSPYIRELPPDIDPSQIDVSSFGSVPQFYRPESAVGVDVERSVEQFTKPPRAGLMETAGMLGGALYDAAVYHVPGSIASSLEGDDPYAVRDWKDQLVERSRARAEERQPYFGNRPTALGPLGDEQDLAGLGQSLGFSAVGMGAGLGAGLATTAALAPVIGPAATIGGYAAGGAASFGTAYQMSTNAFVRDLRDTVDQERAEAGLPPISDAEFNSRREELEPLIQEFGLWEAVPESASNVFGFGVLKAPVKAAIGRVFGKNALTRLATKSAALYGVELGTETVTQQGQHNVSAESGLMDAQRRSWSSAADLGESFKEIAPVTILQTTLMGGGTKIGMMLQDHVQRGRLTRDQYDLMMELDDQVERGQINPEVARLTALESLDPATVGYVEKPSGGTLPGFDAAFNAASRDLDADEIIVEKETKQALGGLYGLPAIQDVPQPLPDVLRVPAASAEATTPVTDRIFGQRAAAEAITAPVFGQRARAAKATETPLTEEAAMSPQLQATVEHLQRAGLEVVDPLTLEIDPETFQFKGGVDAEGVLDTLRSVKQWDDNKAGTIMAYEYADGRRAVADGHQRVGLARRLQPEGGIRMMAKVLREVDGFTPADARKIAAETNIAQGTGTAIDAAKVLREIKPKSREDVLAKMPVGSSMVRDALGLTKLGDVAFMNVVNEQVSPSFGALVGDRFAEPAQQEAAMQVLIRHNPTTADQVRVMLEDMAAAGFQKSEQGGLFGDDQLESLIGERSKILSSALTSARKDKALFGKLVANAGQIQQAGNVLATGSNEQILQQTQHILATLIKSINTTPELNGVLNGLASQVKSGEITSSRAAAQFIEAARTHLEGSGRSGVGRLGDERSRESQPEVPTVTPPADLLGQDTTTQQALADQQREKDAVRSGRPGKETVPVEAGAGELFAGPQPTSLFDQPGETTAPKEAGKAENKYVDADGNEIKLRRVPSYGFRVTNAGMSVAEDENGTLWYERGSYPAKGETRVEKVPERFIRFLPTTPAVAETKAAAEPRAASILIGGYPVSGLGDKALTAASKGAATEEERNAAQAEIDKRAAVKPKPEPRSTSPVAESRQAPDETGDAGVAPGREGAAPGPIADFGQKIEGARKDQYAAYAEQMKKAKDADIAAVPLSQSWPEPDYQALLDGGSDSWLVAFIRAARDQIPTKPKTSWKLHGWTSKVKSLRGFADELLSGEITADQVRSELAKPDYANLNAAIGSLVDLYQAAGHEHSLKGIGISRGQYSMLGGKEINPPRIIWTVEKKAAATAFSNFPTMIAQGDSRAEAIANFKSVVADGKFGEIETKTKTKPKYGIYSARGKSGFFIGKKIGRHTARLKEFAELKEARKYLQSEESQAELDRLFAKYKDIPSERRETNAPRVGIDHRNGGDVTPEQFQEAFGFRGVQFGNYVEQGRRQEDLNEAYDALMDLAGILDLPPRALSLNGELGLAFGARGTGGKKAPKAHFEPDQIVINLTKAKGAGSLAHELWHSLDNYFSRQRKQNGYLTENANKPGEGVRPEMVKAFDHVMRTVRLTSLEKRSSRLDQRRIKPYWSTGREMTARAFESYVIAKMADQGASNDYLANIVSEEYWQAATELSLEKEDTFPYVQAAELPAVRAAYDAFFETVETRETEQGIALFDMGETKPVTRRAEKGTQTLLTRQLEAAISRFTGKPVKAGTYTQVDAPKKHEASVKAVARVFGKRVVFFRANAKTGVSFNGAVLPRDPKTIYINIDSTNPFMGVVGHELLHTLRASHPGLYNRLAERAIAHLKTTGFEDFAAILDAKVSEGKQLTDDKMFEEMVANVMGETFLDPKFLAKLRQQDQSFFQRLVDAIVEILRSFQGRMESRNMGTSRYFNDVENLISRFQSELRDVTGVGRQSESAQTAGEAVPAFQQKPANDTFYSALTETVDKAEGMSKKGNPAAFKQWLDGQQRKGNFKQEERDWMGVDEWLDGHQEVTREGLQKFVAANQIQVEETVLGEISEGDVESWWNDEGGANEETPFGELSPTERRNAMARYADEVGQYEENGTATKFGSYQLPGGENYRELLLTLPHKDNRLPASEAPESDMEDMIPRSELDQQQNIFRSSHFDEPNVLTHVRFNERTDADGKRILFIEEIQSDWHQKGRKEGYRANKKPNTKGFSARKDGTPFWDIYDADGNKVGSSNRAWPSSAEAIDDWAEMQVTEGLPDAPFKKSWPLLAVKRMIRWAAENNFDAVAWTTGEQQAERYDLSKYVDTIGYYKRGDLFNVTVWGKNGDTIWQNQSATADDVERNIGKEILEKMQNRRGRARPFSSGPAELRYLEDLDLKVGGEGMKGFYDKILPSEVNKYVKKWGGRVSETEISKAGEDGKWGVYLEDGSLYSNASTERHALDLLDNLKGRGSIVEPEERDQQLTAVHSLTITPAMRQSALEGQPMFQRQMVFAEPTSTQSETIFRRIHRRLDPVRYVLQDKFIDLKHIQDDKGVTEDQDAYLTESVWQGRAGERLNEFEEERINPLLEQIAKAKLDLAEVDTWLHARHAKEANAYLQEINPRRADNDALSGISNKQAQEILDNHASNAELQEVGRMIDKINAERVDLLVGEGLLTQQIAKAWQTTYRHYVPLKREETGSLLPPRGQGFNVRGPESKRRLGSNRPVVHVVANVIAQYEASVVRTEKNRVGKALLQFAAANPDPNWWTVDKPKKMGVVKNVKRGDTKTAKGTFELEPESTNDRITPEVVQVNDPREYDNELKVKIDGEVHTITFNEQNKVAVRIVRAMKNLDQGEMGLLVKYLLGLNRILAALNTSWSPEFVISNFARDLQTAVYNMTDTELKSAEFAVLKMVPGALKGLRANIRSGDKTSEWDSWVDRFRKAGGKTGWIDHYKDTLARSQNLEKKLGRIQAGKGDRSFTRLKRFVEDYNSIVENGIRLAAFRKAVELGASELKAAGIAKNLTVNFNRRGMSGQTMNALYLFYNASIQGSVRMLQTMIHSKKGRRMAVGTIGIAIALDILNRSLAGDDDDGENAYDALPDHIKSRYWILMKPGGTEPMFKFMLPWGYNTLHVIGQQFGQLATGKNFDAMESSGRIGAAILDAFNPVGHSTFLQTIAPTVTDPLVQIAENKTWTGAPLKPEQLPFGPEVPEYQQHWSSAREISKQIAEKLNDWSGGDEVRPGFANVSPEWLDVFIDFGTGSAGRVVADSFNIAQKAVTGEKIAVNEIPMLRRAYGYDNTHALQTRYYERAEDVQYVKKQIKELAGAERMKATRQPQRRLIGPMEGTESQLRKLRKRRRDLEKRGAPKASIEKTEESIRQAMARFNRLYANIMDQEEHPLPQAAGQ